MKEMDGNMKLIKISSPGWEIDVKDEQKAAEKLWPWICEACRNSDDEDFPPAREGDLASMLNSCCGCEFGLDCEVD